jgi:O-antigen/teichoic acid export membrane protein
MGTTGMTAADPRETAESFRGASAARAVRWSGLSVLGRQGFQIAFAVLLARLIGPESYGAVGAATLLVTLSALLLDQGLAAALVQRAELPRYAPGAAASVNLLGAAALAAGAMLAAPALGAFFATPDLPGMLLWLGPGLLIKAAMIAPRAMLLRRLALAAVGKAEIAGAVVGSVAGAIAALSGAGPAAFVVMTIVSDVLVAVALLAFERGPVPNRHLRAFVPLLGFGSRVFATNGIAYVSRNTDTVLVGRFLGPAPLAQYAMAYRVLVLPVQMLGQSLNRVLFPLLSRLQADRSALAREMERSSSLIAMLTVPPMVLIACGAEPIVRLVLGSAWLPAAPVMTVLALAGARETVFYSVPVLMRACGRADLGLRVQILSTIVQVAGIVAGLRFGMVGVAAGYAIAGVAVTPLLLTVQRRLTDASIGRQLRVLLPPVHAAAWGALAYGVVAVAAGAAGPLLVLLLGAAAFAVAVALVLAIVHRAATRSAFRSIRRIAGGRR